MHSQPVQLVCLKTAPKSGIPLLLLLPYPAEENNIVGLVGPASSGPTGVVQGIAQISNIAQISFSATSPALSDSSVYSTLCRYIPPTLVPFLVPPPTPVLTDNP